MRRETFWLMNAFLAVGLVAFVMDWKVLISMSLGAIFGLLSDAKPTKIHPKLKSGEWFLVRMKDRCPYAPRGLERGQIFGELALVLTPRASSPALPALPGRWMIRFSYVHIHATGFLIRT